MCAKTAMTWGTALFGFIAAALWFLAGFVNVPYKWPGLGEINDNPAVFTGEWGDKSKAIDLLNTAQRQTRWNTWAAMAAAMAAICQSISLML